MAVFALLNPAVANISWTMRWQEPVILVEIQSNQ